MKPPVPYTSHAIRHQINALDALLSQQNVRRDALRLGPRTPQTAQELNNVEREINRLWQGKDYWKNLLDIRLAWERAIRGTPTRPPKQLPRGPAPPPPPPSPFEIMPPPGAIGRSRLPHLVPPFPSNPYSIPSWVPAHEKRCIDEWNAWRDKAERRWDRWMIELDRWDQDMGIWERDQIRRSKREEGISKPPVRPEANLPAPPACPLPDYGDPV